MSKYSNTRTRAPQRKSFKARPQHRRRNQARGPKKENIHPSRFIKKASAAVADAYEPRHTFADFAISKDLLRQIQARGFEAPSPIQDQIIPHGLAGKDVIGIANTGTGKTMAFAIPMLQKLATNPNSRALIMAPTRELAEQILEECRSLFIDRGPYFTLLIGGTSMGRQLRELSRRPRLVIGTPGRIKDHIERNSIDLGRFDTLVLDEVDRMLDMGFIHSMEQIIGRMPRQRQSFFFSATNTAKVTKIIEDFSNQPVLVRVSNGSTTDSVDQNIVYYTDTADKTSKLHSQLEDRSKKVLVFDDSRHRVDRLSKSLVSAGFEAAAIHGGKKQSQRRRILAKFKNSEINILVATDVAARGIDVDGITHVINYSTPQSYADYTHRIGRAGRAGNTGTALTFIGS